MFRVQGLEFIGFEFIRCRNFRKFEVYVFSFRVQGLVLRVQGNR